MGPPNKKTTQYSSIGRENRESSDNVPHIAGKAKFNINDGPVKKEKTI